MGKIKLIVLLLMIVLSFPGNTFAMRSAGSSASLVQKQSVPSTHEADMELKRQVITEVLTKYNAPLLPEVDSFIETCEKYGIDCYLLPSISGVESTFGRFLLPGSHNPFGWGGGYIMFDDYKTAIDTVGKSLKTNYMTKWKVRTIEEIGPIYAESPTWSKKVRYFHNEFTRVEEGKRLYFTRLQVEL